MMNLKEVSYEDFSEFSGESDLSLEDILDLFERMTWGEKSFISFHMTDINAFQIEGTKESDKYLVEITNDSYGMLFDQRYATRIECIDMIKIIYKDPNVTPFHFTGFYKVPIAIKTLDEVIRENE